jgi:hypothetical protein
MTVFHRTPIPGGIRNAAMVTAPQAIVNDYWSIYANRALGSPCCWPFLTGPDYAHDGGRCKQLHS